MNYFISVNKVRQLITRSLASGAIITALIVSGLTATRHVQADSGQDCDNNAVIYCGVSSVSDLQSKYNNGDGHNSGGNIQHIYNWFDISDSDMQTLGSTAKNGKVTDQGNVYIDNTIVATDALTAGRQDASGSSQQTNKDTTFYTRPPSISFKSQSLDAYVIMKDGVFQFAIIKSCGNPVKATAQQQPEAKSVPQPKPAPAPTPAPSPAPAAQPNVCSGDTTNSNTDGVASQGGNCSINTTTIVQQIQETPPTPPAQPETPAPSPSGQCDSLSVTAASSSTPMTVQASVNYSAQNGAQLKSIVYDFGDGTTTTPTNQTSMTHTYAQAGTYSIKATLQFGNGTTTASTAGTSTTGSVSTSEASVDSSTNVSTSTSSTTGPSLCQAAATIAAAPTPPPSTPITTSSAPIQPVAAPQQLANTGPGSVAAIFTISTVGSSLIFNRYLRRHIV